MLTKWLAARRTEIRAARDSGNNLLLTLIVGVLASTGGYVISTLLNTIAQTWIVRQLGPAMNGEYAVVLSSLSMFSVFLGLGLDTWLHKEGGAAPEALATNVWQVLLLKLAGSILLLVVMAFFWTNHIFDTPAFAIGVATIIVNTFTLTGYAALRASRNNSQVAVFQTLDPLLLLAALFLLDLSGPNLLLLMIARLVCSIVLFTALMRQLRELIGPPQFVFHLPKLVHGSWLFVVADILSNVYGQATLFILGTTVGTLAAGLFKPALDLISLTYTVPTLVFLVGLPLLSSPNLTTDNFRKLIGLMAGGLLAYGVIVSTTLYLFSERITQTLYSAEYAGTVAIVEQMSVIPLLKCGSFVCAAIMLSRGRQGIRVVAQAIVTIGCFVLGYQLIPQFAIGGAIWMSVGIEVVLLALYILGAVLALRLPRR